MSLAVFGAAALQAATGIGFGVVAGPILLAILNSGDAIQVSILMNLLIAAVLAPSLRTEVDWKLLKWLLAGTAIGMPIGLFVFLSVDIVKLKLMAALAVLLAMGFVLRNLIRQHRDASVINPNPSPPVSRSLPMGVISGVMGGSLAMPGPVPAGWMSAVGYGKAAIRASILMLFVFSYAAALLLQFPLVGIKTETYWLSLMLVPPTLIGIGVGRALTRFISERTFSWLVVVTLALTAALLLITIIQGM